MSDDQGLRLVDVDARQGAGAVSVSVSRGTVVLLPGSVGAVVGAGMCKAVNGSRALECSGDFEALDQVWCGAGPGYRRLGSTLNLLLKPYRRDKVGVPHAEPSTPPPP